MDGASLLYSGRKLATTFTVVNIIHKHITKEEIECNNLLQNFIKLGNFEESIDIVWFEFSISVHL